MCLQRSADSPKGQWCGVAGGDHQSPWHPNQGAEPDKQTQTTLTKYTKLAFFLVCGWETRRASTQVTSVTCM